MEVVTKVQARPKEMGMGGEGGGGADEREQIWVARVIGLELLLKFALSTRFLALEDPLGAALGWSDFPPLHHLFFQACLESKML